jgi:hypothetical protein
MSKSKIVTTIQKELARVNEEIDLKILRGEPYKREARHHKVLLSQLKQIGYTRSFSFFSFL